MLQSPMTLGTAPRLGTNTLHITLQLAQTRRCNSYNLVILITAMTHLLLAEEHQQHFTMTAREMTMVTNSAPTTTPTSHCCPPSE